ncbi:MAG: hypothetical protein VX498_15980, partial [Myxococcota bacterium]|nr:hypothetical protein [Myxococcota bacterium]
MSIKPREIPGSWTRSGLLFCLTLLCVGLVACEGRSRGDGGAGADDDDEPTPPCDTEFWLTAPDGST